MKSWLFGKKENITKSGIIWNAFGGGIFSAQSAIILVFVSRVYGLYEAGMVTFAYALANIFWSISRYGVRNYQVTDTREQILFSDYFWQRVITSGISIIILIMLLTYNTISGIYLPEKAILICEITCLKVLDAFEEVFVSRYQQIGRLDIGAKIMTFRLTIITILMCILVCCNFELYIVFAIGIVASIIIELCLVKLSYDENYIIIKKINANNVKMIFRTCLPLCISMTLYIYIGNIPKYLIDTYFDDTTQAIYGYLMLPVFTISLLSQFIYQPFVKKLGELWDQKRLILLKKNVLMQSAVILLLTVLVLVLGLFIGLPMLSVLYNSNLIGYSLEFSFLLLGGGLNALALYLNVPITTIREQKYLPLGAGIAILLAYLLSDPLVLTRGVRGVSEIYVVVNLTLVIIYTLVFLVGTNHKNRGENE